MIETIFLKFTEATQPLRLDAEGVTILVGPNNSGKSLLLREIERKINEPAIPGKIVADIDVSFPSPEEFALQAAALNERAPEGSREGYVHLFRYSKGAMEAGGNELNWFLSILGSRNKAAFMSNFINFFVIRLDGRTRFSLVDDRERGDLSGKVPVNFIAKIFMEDPLRNSIREVCLDAFNKYFVLDPTSGSLLKIRLSSTPPLNAEQSLNAAARQFHAAAQYIKDASDGVQVFLGIIMAVFAGDYMMVLLDEPEAFLHPPLARKLGYRLALRATQRKEALFSATHSADFLMGCLQGTSRVKVLRLEYSDGKSKGTLVDSDALLNFLSKPLIRNSNVISALFHDGVVVTESENDRAFYSEIYHRLADEDKGLPSLLFVSAQNKQTIRDMIGPLRSFGVPAAGVVDIDILKRGRA
jgi:predicted ATPase